MPGLAFIRPALAALAGLALACAFPTANQASLAWLAPGLMLGAALGTRGRQSFALGYLAGFVQHLVALRWLLNIPFPAGAVAGWIALSAYVALYQGTWVWACLRFLPEAASRGSADTDPPGSWQSAVSRLADQSWQRRAAWCVAAGASWAAGEMILGRFLSGFPWNFLGTSQYQALPLIQIASVTGVYGVSFLVAWASTAVLVTSVKVLERIVAPAAKPAWPAAGPTGRSPLRRLGSPRGPHPLVVSFRFALMADLGAPLLVIVALMIGASGRLLTPPPPAPELRVAVVQPSIPQRLIFDSRESTNRFNAIMELSGLALAAHPDLLVWPESSLPGFEESHYRALTNLVARHKAWMVFGADDAEPAPLTEAAGKYRYYNSAFLLDPQGRLAGTYRKRRLVIFGEYVPLERWLPFAKYLTPIDGSFTPGPGPVWFRTAPPEARFAPLICFEDVFPESARAAVDPETDFLLNLTNNGWFGEAAAQWQQAASAVFRAVENRVPLVRCTNNGLTCWIDANGRLREAGLDSPREVYGPGFKIFRVPLRPPGTRRTPTFYGAHGDVFGWGCVGVALLGLAGTWRRHPVAAREFPTAPPAGTEPDKDRP